jgi:hypothetical protein
MFGRLHVLPVVTRFLAAYPDVSVGPVMTDRVAFVDFVVPRMRERLNDAAL